MASGGRLVVIGCGNLNRSDDGVGVIVAHRLKQWLSDEPREDVAVFDAGTGGMDVMFHARGATSLILVDACTSGSQPGSLFRLPGEEVVARPEPGYSLHEFRWDHALYAGRRIFGDAFPRDVTVYLVEAATVSLGLDLSPEVSKAVNRVADCIKEQIRERTDTQPGQSGGPARIEIRRGNIYVEAGVYARYFGGLESLVLLRRDEKLLLLPVRHAAAGGLLLKIRNTRGDRIVHAQEFFRDQGLDEQQEWSLPVRWDSRSAALVVEWPPSKL
jgi:hydrogenase maturation protease